MKIPFKKKPVKTAETPFTRRRKVQEFNKAVAKKAAEARKKQEGN